MGYTKHVWGIKLKFSYDVQYLIFVRASVIWTVLPEILYMD